MPRTNNTRRADARRVPTANITQRLDVHLDVAAALTGGSAPISTLPAIEPARLAAVPTALAGARAVPPDVLALVQLRQRQEIARHRVVEDAGYDPLDIFRTN